jgi:hypothetical protein
VDNPGWGEAAKQNLWSSSSYGSIRGKARGTNGEFIASPPREITFWLPKKVGIAAKTGHKKASANADRPSLKYVIAGIQGKNHDRTAHVLSKFSKRNGEGKSWIAATGFPRHVICCPENPTTKYT